MTTPAAVIGSKSSCSCGTGPHRPYCKLYGNHADHDAIKAEGPGQIFVIKPRLTTLAEAERTLIFATLDHFGGDKKLAAESLGVSLKTVYNRLNHYAALDAAERKAA